MSEYSGLTSTRDFDIHPKNILCFSVDKSALKRKNEEFQSLKAKCIKAQENEKKLGQDIEGIDVQIVGQTKDLRKLKNQESEKKVYQAKLESKRNLLKKLLSRNVNSDDEKAKIERSKAKIESQVLESVTQLRKVCTYSFHLFDETCYANGFEFLQAVCAMSRAESEKRIIYLKKLPTEMELDEVKQNLDGILEVQYCIVRRFWKGMKIKLFEKGLTRQSREAETRRGGLSSSRNGAEIQNSERWRSRIRNENSKRVDGGSIQLSFDEVNV